MENIGDKIKSIVVTRAGSAVLGTLAVAAITYFAIIGSGALVLNREDVGEDYTSITRFDVALGYTNFTKYRGDLKQDQVFQTRIFGQTIIILDGGIYGKNDGLTDRIEITCPAIGGVTGTLTREEHYSSRFKSEFDKADRILAETKRRFGKDF